MRALERDFPGLLPLLTPPWRDVGCVVFAAVAKAYYESTKSSFFAEMFEGNDVAAVERRHHLWIV